ncbi:MAG: epoxyqueuosine reductase [Candidatus Glassbacteria bacterium]|nr:epoxyqueuosine reductase [Candidatus Glassbacteria bacterium]
MTAGELGSKLDSYVTERGAAFTAFADLGILPAGSRMGLPTGVLIGLALAPEIVAGIGRGPTPEYAAEYNRANEKLEFLAEECAAFLIGNGYRAEPGKPSMYIRDRSALKTDLPHKTVATLAGVGWIGKCALLVTRRWGSAVRYNVVLTDAPLPAGTPLLESECGDCIRCVEECPAGAPLGVEWRAGMEREELYNAVACRDCARRLAVAIGSNRTICGICIAACPHTEAYISRNGG